MERYNLGRRCPKCDNLSTFDRYFKNKNKIRRKCTRCEYLWWEEPLDTFAENLDDITRSDLKNIK